MENRCPKCEEPLDKGKGVSSAPENSLAEMDMETLLRKMKNQRYALVIRLLIVEDLPPEKVRRCRADGEHWAVGEEKRGEKEKG